MPAAYFLADVQLCLRVIQLSAQRWRSLVAWTSLCLQEFGVSFAPVMQYVRLLCRCQHVEAPNKH